MTDAFMQNDVSALSREVASLRSKVAELDSAVRAFQMDKMVNSMIKSLMIDLSLYFVGGSIWLFVILSWSIK